MNPFLAKVTGISETADVVPAVAHRTQRPTRDRLEKERKQRSRAVAGVLGVMETDDRPVIPDDAEQLDGPAGPVRQIPGINDIERASVKVTDPYGAKEEMLSPNVALVAPDVTPMATEPIDLSVLPNAEAELFKAADTAKEAPSSPADIGKSSKPTAVDVLLGRTAKGAQTIVPPPASPAPARVPEVPTTEAAYRMMGAVPPSAQRVEEAEVAEGAAPLGAATMYAPLPDEPPPPTDIKVVLESFRAFGGPRK